MTGREVTMGDERPQIRVSDKDIQKIIDENEAGTADLMAVYERAEASYVAAVSQGYQPPSIYPASTDSVPQR